MTVQADVDDRLYVAADTGDLDTIEQLFSSDPIPNVNSVHDWSEQTALHAASVKGHLGVVEYLIRRGADVQAVNGFGRTAAHLICDESGSSNSLAVLQMLFETDHSIIERQDPVRERTCLGSASKRAKANIVQWLLDMGADATTKNKLNDTAWDVVTNDLFSGRWRPEPCPLEDAIETYRAFVRKEIKDGNIDGALYEMDYELIGDLQVFRLGKANITDSFILLEYSMHLPALRPACRQIRLELSHFIKTGNRLRYREPSCVIETQSRQQYAKPNAVFGGVCDRSSYESFKTLISVEDRKARPTASRAKISKPVLKPNLKTLESAELKQSNSDYLSLVMPFIATPSFWAFSTQRKDLTRSFRYRSDNKGDLQGFHSRLTIDEYCYPALSEEILKRRNTDQTVTRFERSNDTLDLLRLIVIDQAWIWLFQDVLIYTSQGGTSKFEATSYMDGYSSKYARVGQFVANLIDSTLFEYIFDVFQSSIVMLAEEVSGYIDREGIESITIEKERQFYHKINDIREELSMIRRVLSQQEEVWRQFASNIWPELWTDDQHGRVNYSAEVQNNMSPGDRKALTRLIMRPRLRVRKAQQRIVQLDEDAERVERSIAIQLDLKQKHASLQEAHATAVMSTAVFGFTIITIIFTPLTFVLSLFALPVDRFEDNQMPSRWSNEAGMYSTKYIGTWAATTEVISIGLTILAMWLALEYGLKYRISLKIWNLLKNSNRKTYRMYEYLSLSIGTLKRKGFLFRKSKVEEKHKSDQP